VNIELMSIGEDLSEPMTAAMALFNAVQGEFRFRMIPAGRQLEGLTFERDTYRTQEVWEFMEAYRARGSGQPALLLGFVNHPLASDRLQNLFGSHDAKRGLAVATLHGHIQFVSDPKRYMAYYMVRYTLSFIAPDLLSHNDPARKDCYFHKKLYKPDIRASMTSGTICDPCMGELDKHTSPEQRKAIKALRDVVSGQYPYALIMKGGGIKGLAFAGALLELERYFSFDIFAGASAGAITAVLLGAGYTPAELRQTLGETSFRKFLDASRLRSLWNLLTTYGLYSGDAFERWIKDLLTKKIPKMGRIEMRHLHDSVVYACTPGHGTVVFDSRGNNKSVDAAFAARCSMSIPFFFRPMTIEQRRVYDGGMRNNFPVARFLADNPGRPFIALYLGEPLGFRKSEFVLSELMDIWLGGDELAIIDSHADSVAVINPKPISTLDFSLTAKETEFLLKAGRAAAMRLVLNRKMDSAATPAEVEQAEKEVEELRATLTKARAVRWRKRLLCASLLVVVLALLVWFRRWIVSGLWWPHFR
jgi:predicted acylesterase/phospholipase RssA